MLTRMEWKEAETCQEEEWRQKGLERNGRTEFSKVRGPNENISGYFSRMKALKTQN